MHIRIDICRRNRTIFRALENIAISTPHDRYAPPCNDSPKVNKVTDAELFGHRSQNKYSMYCALNSVCSLVFRTIFGILQSASRDYMQIPTLLLFSSFLYIFYLALYIMQKTFFIILGTITFQFLFLDIFQCFNINSAGSSVQRVLNLELIK